MIYTLPNLRYLALRLTPVLLLITIGVASCNDTGYL